MTFPQKRPRNSSLFSVCKNYETCRPTPETLHIRPSNYCRMPRGCGQSFSVRMATSFGSSTASSSEKAITVITAKHRSGVASDHTDAQTLPGTEITDQQVQAEVADLSLYIRLHDHSPRYTSGTFSARFPDSHESPISVERPISVNNSAEMRMISVGKFFPTEIGQGIPSLQAL